jgi:hypothetical protein
MSQNISVCPTVLADLKKDINKGENFLAFVRRTRLKPVIES